MQLEMKPSQWIWVLILCLSGAGTGSAWLQGWGENASQAAPDGWQRLEEKVPFRRSDLLGSLGPSSASYSLDHFQGLVAQHPSTKWDIELTLGAGGEARIALAGRAPKVAFGMAPTTAGNQLIGDGIFLSRTGSGIVEALSFGSGQQRSLNCQGSLPAPDGQRYRLSLTKTARGFTAESGAERMDCESPQGSGNPILIAGLERIRIVSSTTDAGSFSSPFMSYAGGVGALLGILCVLGIWRIERRLGADRRVAVLTSTPLLLSWSLQGADRMLIVENMRMPGLSETSLAVVVPLILTACLKLAHHAALRARSNPHVVKGLRNSALICTAGFLVISLASQPKWAMAIGYFTIAGAFFGLLVGINAVANRARLVNLLSLAFLSLTILSAEWAVRWTQTGHTWTPTGRMNHDMQLGWTRSTLSDFEALEKAEPTTYPSSGYPVSIQPDSNKTRWICLGSSATGGAFQNDNLAEFYPARIQELLEREVQVLNQGVGGWTSFHIAQYFEREAASLKPDVISIYIGHNDILTRSSKPYKDLYENWKTQGAPKTPLPSFRLFQGFRFLMSSLLNNASSTAVPVEDARENLLNIHRIASTYNAKILLIPEAITPDSASLRDYDTMLRELSDTHPDMAYLDAPSLLLQGGGNHFLDDVHLSQTGHRLLAQAMTQKIRELQWISPSEGADKVGN